MFALRQFASGHRDLKYWEWLENALELLGQDSMSLDDSDDDAGMPVTQVRNMPWRNKSLTVYLEVLNDRSNLQSVRQI